MNVDLFRDLVDGAGHPDQYVGLAILAGVLLAVLWIKADAIGGGDRGPR